MIPVSRRGFFKRSLAAGLAGGLAVTAGQGAAHAQTGGGQVGTLIDLTRCDGCAGEKAPRCVVACRIKNQTRFPEPVKPIPANWPKGQPEDWSDKKQVMDRLTPYNWTYLQKATVQHAGREQEVFIPRRCMHCDNPACVALCPYSAQEKKPEGPVVINDQLCLGGAKCRDVCPWGIPSRQAGVGLYLAMAPYAGGGVMYKCDGCYDQVKVGSAPACVQACPKQAMLFGEKEAMRAEARRRAEAIGGHVYGDKENGGTSTFYVSAVPFEAIDKALKEQSVDGKPGRSGMPVGVGNYMDPVNDMTAGLLAAPVAGLLAAGYLAYQKMSGEE